MTKTDMPDPWAYKLNANLDDGGALASPVVTICLSPLHPQPSGAGGSMITFAFT